MQVKNPASRRLFSLNVPALYGSCSSISLNSRCAPATSAALPCRPLSASRVWGRVSCQTLVGPLLQFRAVSPFSPAIAAFLRHQFFVGSEVRHNFLKLRLALPSKLWCLAFGTMGQSRPGHLAR